MSSKKKETKHEILQTADIRTLVKQGISGRQALAIAIKQRELEEASRPQEEPKPVKKGKKRR